MFKRKLPVLVARRLEIDQGLYDVGPDRHQSQVELRIRKFWAVAEWECGRFGVSILDTRWINSGPLIDEPPASLSAPNGANCCGAGLIQGRRMGRYIDEILQPGERVLYSTNEHWMFFLPAIAAWIVAVAFLVLWRLVTAAALMLVCLALAAVAGLAALYWTATAWFHRWTTETDVTNMRVVHKTGSSSGGPSR